MKEFILILLFSFPALASPWQHLEHGDQTAQDFLNRIEEKKAEAGAHPFYDGATPLEATFTEESLKGRSQSAARQEPISQMIQKSAEARPQFKIDPQTDPLFTRAQKVMEKPLTEIGGEGTHVVELTQEGKDEMHVCEEPGEDFLETCTQDLKINILKKKIRKEWEGNLQLSKCSNAERKSHYLPCMALRNALDTARWAVSPERYRYYYEESPIDIKTALNITAAYKACINELAANGRSCYECNAFLPPLPVKMSQVKEILFEQHPHNSSILHMAYDHFHMYKSGRYEYNSQPYFKVIYEEDSYEILPDEWISTCDELERRDDQGLCSYHSSKVCVQGRETRLIDGIPITRDCWQYRLTYACKYPSHNDCGPLRARGCIQIDSTCKQKVADRCVVYSQTYQCKGNTKTTTQIVGGQTPFCLDGNCRDQSYEANDEMMSSLAQLSLLKEMEGKFKEGLIFKGDHKQCSKYIFKFIDCCGSGKGWGKDIGFKKCKPYEKELHKKRKAGLCHYVGTYCDKKVLGKCIKKQASFCCFPNKLLKVFQEQGRAQIGKSWGEPKHPLCEGFTIEEIQKIDFSKLDLREVFEDLMKSFKPSKQDGVEQDAHTQMDKTDFNQIFKDVMHKAQPTQIQNVEKRVEERIELIKKGMK